MPPPVRRTLDGQLLDLRDRVGLLELRTRRTAFTPPPAAVTFQSLPAGSIVLWRISGGSPTLAPPGPAVWLRCDGSVFNTADYPDLAASGAVWPAGSDLWATPGIPDIAGTYGSVRYWIKAT